MDPNSGTVNALKREVRLVSPQRPDPLGSHEVDWEYEGRYLELERRLLDQAARNGARSRKRARNGAARGRGLEWESEAQSDHEAAREPEALWRAPNYEHAYRFRYPRTGNHQAQQL